MESISARYTSDPQYWSAACQAISIPDSKLQELLASGIKVVSSNKWNETISCLDGSKGKYEATCNGTSYILEGPEKELLSLN